MSLFSAIFKITTALLATSQMSFAACTDCTVLEFGKKAQTHKVLPLFSGNMLSKTQYLQKQGIDLFKLPTPLKEEITLDFLKTPPEVLQRNFAKHFAEGTLGLYLTERSHSNFVEKPTIIFLDSVNSWTIAHEYMHYLFDRARAMEDSRSESILVSEMKDANEDFRSYWERYKNYGRFLSQQHKEGTIASFVAFSEMQQQVLLTFEMEEMTIERYLRRIFTSDLEHDLTQESFNHSADYIRSTANKSLAVLNVTLDICDDLESILLESDRNLKRQLTSVCTPAENLRQAVIAIGAETNIQLDSARNSY